MASTSRWSISAKSIHVVSTATVPYPPEVRAAILSVSNAATHTATIARLNFLLGELFAEALRNTGVPLETIELIGSHGQTIFHEGEPVEFLGRKIASTMQIGEAAVIAERTGIETIADFRRSDIAAGGKGAPLVPFLDYQLFRHPELARIALNIGGIANITVIPANAKPEDVIAFDTGPGNMVMDAFAPPFDRDGERARAGHVNAALLERLLADPYYHREPPKSCGREQYGAEFVRDDRHRYRDCDGIDRANDRAGHRTLSRHPRGDRLRRRRAQSLSDGAAARAGAARVTTSAEFGIGVDAKEAILFALLAYQTYQRTRGQSAVRHGRAQTDDSGQNFARNKPAMPGA